MKYGSLFLSVCLLWLLSACSLFERNATPTPVPVDNVATAVAETLTAVAPTGTPTAETTATPATPQPTPVPTESVVPLAYFESPEPNAQFSAGEIINIGVTALDNAGIARVELYADNQFVQAASPKVPAPTVRVAFTWSSTVAGQHVLSVVPYDVSGNAGTAATLPLTILQNAPLPTVQILAPTSPQTLQAGAQMVVRVTADAPQGITQLQLFVDDAPYSYTAVEKPRAPFSASFVYIASAPGVHNLTVRALDAQQRVGVSSPLAVTVVDTRAPVVQVTYSAGVIRQGEILTVNILAADANGISAVQLWADNALFDQYIVPNPRQQTSLSLQKQWSSRNVGTHTLFVRVMDSRNQSVNSPLTNILVIAPNQPTPVPTRVPTNTPRPTTPPTSQPQPAPSIQIMSPGFGCVVQLPDALNISIQFSSPSGLRQLITYAQYNGVMARPINSTDAQGQRSYMLYRDWTPADAGIVEIFATATDVNGQRSESAHVSCVIQSPTPPTPIPPTPKPNPPSAAIVSPAMGCRIQANDDIHIIADFSGEAGLGDIQLYAQYGGLMAQPIYSDNGNGQNRARVTYDWTASAEGTVQIFATVIDYAGQRAESNHAPCEIVSPAPPTYAPAPTDEPAPTYAPPPTEAPPPTDEPVPTYAPMPTDEPPPDQ